MYLCVNFVCVNVVLYVYIVYTYMYIHIYCIKTQVKKNVQINDVKKSTFTTLHGAHTNTHPTSKLTRKLAKPYFHGMRMLQRKKAALELAAEEEVQTTRARARTQRAAPLHFEQLAKKKAAPKPTTYYKAGPDQASRDKFLASGYRNYIAAHHVFQGGKDTNSETLSKYAEYVTSPSQLPTEAPPDSLGFKF
jgi:hypothetical protein